jgi:HPt (histidine-containing phosphotransfer) domain-containing protein
MSGLTVGAVAAPESLGAARAIDRSVLGEWLAGDDAAIDEMLMVFRDSLIAEHGRMRDAVARGGLDDFASAAHRLRGAAQSMGARGVAEVAGILGAAAQARNKTACRDGLSVLETHICLVAAEIPSGGNRSSET